MTAFKSELLATPVMIFANDHPRGVTMERQQFTALDRHIGTNRCVLPWAFLYKDTLQLGPLHALAATLDTYPTLSGRVCPVKASSWLASFSKAPNWELLCNNAGVPLSIHSSNATLQQLLDSGTMCSRRGFIFPDAAAALPAYMERLDPVAVLAGCAPVLVVRLTQLAGGGSILAVTASHVVLDGRSYVKFMQQWAKHYNAIILRSTTPTAGLLTSIQEDPQGHPASVAVGPNQGPASSRSRANDKKQLMIELTAAAAPTSTTRCITAAAPPAASAEVGTVASSCCMCTTSSSRVIVTNKAALQAADITTAAVATDTAGTKCGINDVAGPSLKEAAIQNEAVLSTPPVAAAAAVRADVASANNLQSNSKDFPYTPDPLFATRNLPPGWSTALRATKVAIQQVRAEEKYIRSSLKLQSIQADALNNNSSSSRPSSALGNGKTDAGKAGLKASKAPAVDTRSLSTELMHIPQEALQKLKATASLYCREGQYISTNDAVSSLVWLLMCQLRGRPLPGQPRPPALQDTCLGLALDLRTTTQAATHSNQQPQLAAPSSSVSSLPQQQTSSTNELPMEFFGSAAWSVNVRSCNEDGAAAAQGEVEQQLPLAWHASLTAKELSMMCAEEQVLVKSLAAGAVRVRGALQAIRRSANFAGLMLQQVEGSLAAPVSSQIAMAASLVHRLDAFVTSWQFGIFDVKFGGQESNPGHPMFQGLVNPVPPYHAVVMPAPFGTEEAMLDQVKGTDDVGTAAAGGGIWCWISVPSCLVESMVRSPVLEVLVPEARWLSLPNYGKKL